MARIQVGGAGGAPSNNFIKSLRASGRGDYMIGTSTVPSDLFLADTEEKYVVPRATSPEYREAILGLLQKTRPSLLHVQNDFEVRAISRIRDDVQELGVRLFLPAPETIEN